MISGYTPLALQESAGCELARDDDEEVRTVERLGISVYTTEPLSGRGGKGNPALDQVVRVCAPRTALRFDNVPTWHAVFEN